MNATAPPADPQTPMACDHCGLPVPAALRVEDGDAPQFCCHGCRAVYDLLHRCDLDDYYRLRDSFAPTSDPRETAATPDAELPGDRYETFGDPAFLEAHTQSLPGGSQRVDLLVTDAHCAACLWLLERLPRVCPGVTEARLSLRRKVVRITWQPDAVSLPQIARALHRLGYPPRPDSQDPDDQRAARRRDERRRWIGMAVAGACAGNAMLLAFALYSAEGEGTMDAGFETLFRLLSAIVGTIALAGPGRVFFRGAWAALRTRAANLDLPIALALLAGGVAGLINTALGTGDLYFDSLTVLVFLLLVGRYVQYRQQRWADDAVGLMLTLTPVTCRIVRQSEGRDAVHDAPIEALRTGDTVEVRPGELLPGDGVVLSGASQIDQATLTGESVPVPVDVDAEVFGGTRNVAGTLRVRVERVGEDCRVGRLMHLVGDGLDQRPPIVLLTDRIAGVFTAALTLLATATFLGWAVFAGTPAAGLSHAVAMLILACPCALALATPLTLAIATGQAAQRDILIKRAAVLQTLDQPHSNPGTHATLWLDKTGTLTRGEMSLMRWHGDATLQPLVAALEAESTHPIGRCLHHSAERPDAGALSDGASGFRFTRRTERGDGGVSATWHDPDHRTTHTLTVGNAAFLQRRHDEGPSRSGDLELPANLLRAAHDTPQRGHTAVLVALDGVVRAVAVVGDALRDEAPAVVDTCRAAGWTPGILTGDAPAAAAFVARRVGVEPDRVVAGVLPEEKLERLRQRQPNRLQVLVGDGVNDAAALAAADVGLAVRGGAEAALAAADVFLARDGLTAIPELLRLARGTMRTVRLNLSLSLVYNSAAVTLAAAGLVTPLLAAILMPISSATVLGVALLGLKWNTRDAQPTPGTPPPSTETRRASTLGLVA
ncbi:MAG: heavy metal translocating P-type ATPase [Planctomycetota bacterium]